MVQASDVCVCYGLLLTELPKSKGILYIFISWQSGTNNLFYEIPQSGLFACVVVLLEVFYDSLTYKDGQLQPLFCRF